MEQFGGHKEGDTFDFVYTSAIFFLGTAEQFNSNPDKLQNWSQWTRHEKLARKGGMVAVPFLLDAPVDSERLVKHSEARLREILRDEYGAKTLGDLLEFPAKHPHVFWTAYGGHLKDNLVPFSEDEQTSAPALSDSSGACHAPGTFAWQDPQRWYGSTPLPAATTPSQAHSGPAAVTRAPCRHSSIWRGLQHSHTDARRHQVGLMGNG